MKKIAFTVDRPKKKKKKANPPRCWVCLDMGLVIYDKKIDGIIYETAARCRCVQGQNMGNRIGTIPDVMMEDIAKVNFENFRKAFPEETKKITQVS
ncbi:MAG TPA: hypothetical protein GX526_01080 [Thermoanaerobacterales bacterium]|nr:hypothetical protein [Thermoanaerobacterales bacterium]